MSIKKALPFYYDRAFLNYINAFETFCSLKYTYLLKRDKQLTPEEKHEFMMLYEPCHAKLNRFCMALCRTGEEAADVVQETLLVSLEGFHKLRDKSVFQSFLFGIALNLNRQRIRKMKFEAVFNWALMEERPEAGSRIEFGAEMYLINKLLHKLPEVQKECFVLFEFADISIKEIAAVQNCNPNTVKTRLSRAREKLLKMLQKESGFETSGNTGLLHYSLNKDDNCKRIVSGIGAFGKGLQFFR